MILETFEFLDNQCSIGKSKIVASGTKKQILKYLRKNIRRHIGKFLYAQDKLDFGFGEFNRHYIINSIQEDYNNNFKLWY